MENKVWKIKILLHNSLMAIYGNHNLSINLLKYFYKQFYFDYRIIDLITLTVTLTVIAPNLSQLLFNQYIYTALINHKYLNQ